MKTSLLYTICWGIILSSCATNPTKNQKIIGGQKDKHGCLKAAGYSWSQLRQNCIHPFEEGTALMEINPSQTYQAASFILFNNDKSKVEIYLPTKMESVILERKKDHSYSNDNYQLILESSCWSLYVNNKKSFEEKIKAIQIN